MYFVLLDLLSSSRSRWFIDICAISAAVSSSLNIEKNAMRLTKNVPGDVAFTHPMAVCVAVRVDDVRVLTVTVVATETPFTYILNPAASDDPS